MIVNADIKKFLPRTWLETTGKNIPALIEALNVTHKRLEDLVQGCIDQLFTQTATGRFLIQLGEQEGFTMPANSGLDITAYRPLVPLMVANPKQVRLTIDELIQSFYSAERTKASVVSSVQGPFSLNDGDDLIIETESGEIVISIVEGQVSNLANVIASEIAAVINSTQSSVIADTVTDRTTALDYLRITSITSGASSKIRVAGGKLQNVLKFPKLIATLAATGTTWNIEKQAAYTDTLTFTWDGIGVNPNVYLSSAGDVLTIRGLTDGVDPFSLLNGSYTLVDVGYDYFIIRSSLFQSLNSTLIQPSDNSIVFTSKDRQGLYDRDEYAFTSEIDVNTITMTVPAIPPLGRRFLAGSTHLHGVDAKVLDFTRSSIKLELSLSSDRPTSDSFFLLHSNTQKIDFRHPYYKINGVDDNLTQPTYTLDTGDETQAILPYTLATPIGTDPIQATVDSSEYVVTFPFRHGLEYSWGFNLTGATGSANILAGDLNKEHEVTRIIDKNTLAFRLKTAGAAIPYQGVSFGPADVYRHASSQSNDSDFYLQFTSGAAAIASGLAIGMVFKFDTIGGTDIIPYIANSLRYRKLIVIDINGSKIDFQAGIGPAPGGQIIDDVTGKRSATIGGAISYHLDKASAINQDRVFNNNTLSATIVGHTPSTNPAYISAYLYDPDGDKNTVTVSKYTVNTTQSILRGDNLVSLIVDSATVGGKPFPQAGKLVIDYGTNSFEGPVRYFAVVENPGSNQILIDPAYKFKKTHIVGANVQFIHSDQVFKPLTNGIDYPYYITGIAQARNTMFALAELLVAAGIFVKQDVLLPDLRYADTQIIPFD